MARLIVHEGAYIYFSENLIFSPGNPTHGGRSFVRTISSVLRHVRSKSLCTMGEPSAQLQRNPEATCYIGGLDEKVNEEILFELCMQAGPIVSVFMPRDKVTGNHPGYGFVEFRAEEDAEYAMKVLNMVPLFHKAIRVNKSAAESKTYTLGANLYIGNLAADVDEKLLYDTFSAFGGIVGAPGIVRDAETNASKGYGFVSFDSFEASDLAIECMHNQFLANRTLQVQYALKKEGHGERHGTQAERLLASQTQVHVKFKPHTLFGAGEVPAANNQNAHAQQQLQFQGQEQPQGMMIPGYGFAPQMPEWQLQQQQQQQQQQYQHGHDQQYGYAVPPPLPIGYDQQYGYSQQGYGQQYGYNQAAFLPPPVPQYDMYAQQLQYNSLPPPPPPPPLHH